MGSEVCLWYRLGDFLLLPLLPRRLGGPGHFRLGRVWRRRHRRFLDRDEFRARKLHWKLHPLLML